MGTTTRQLESLVRERCRSGGLTVPEILGLFDRLLASSHPAPSIHSFNFLFTSLVRIKDATSPYATVISLFNRLARTDGISPNTCTYGICIDCCVGSNQLHLGFVLLGRFLKERQSADLMVFNPLLKGLCRAHRIHEAATIVLDKMPKLGCKPDVYSYNTLIKGYCSVGKTSFAIELLQKNMTECGEFKPDRITYTTVIQGLCKEGAFSKAFNLLEQMLSVGIPPNISTYTIVMDTLCKKGLMDKVEKLLKVMLVNGVTPDLIAVL